MPRTVRQTLERRLTGVAQQALWRLRKRGNIAIILATGSELRKLKQAYYRKKSKETVPDVLSFTDSRRFPHPEVRGKFLGEVYLHERLMSDPRRLKFLLIHGLLHLLGYSHSSKRDTVKMQSLEQKLLGRRR